MANQPNIPRWHRDSDGDTLQTFVYEIEGCTSICVLNSVERFKLFMVFDNYFSTYYQFYNDTCI